MKEYYFPYDKQNYELFLEPTPPKKTEQKSILKTVYHRIVPRQLRKTFWRYRNDPNRIYPHQIEMRVNDMSANYIVHNLREEVRVSTNGSEKEYLLAVSREILPNDVIWDIGAYQGTFSLPLASKHKDSNFIAFEPDSTYLNILKENISLNKVDTIAAYPYAVSNVTAEEKFFLHSQNGHCSALRQLYKDNAADFALVQSITADDCVGIYGIPYPDIVKIDVEGAELMVLQGMRNTRPRSIFLEIHEPILLEQYNTNAVSIYNEVIEKGYKAESVWLRPSALLCHFKLKDKN